MTSHRKIAAALGVSKNLVRWLEISGLRKIAVALGFEPIPIPRFLARTFGKPRKRRYRCKSCGEFGHRAQTCMGPGLAKAHPQGED